MQAAKLSPKQKERAFQEVRWGQRAENIPVLEQAGITVDKFGGEAFRAAVSDGQAELAKLLLEKGADINYHKPDMVFPYASTPVTEAARSNNFPIVLLETMKAADKDHRVFKLQFEAGEFDMVIYDQKENSCEIFEIKHSSKQVPFQYRHLVDEDKCQRTERRFGPIHGRYILYRGEDAQMENGVQYWNVENYLKALPTLDIVQVQEIGMQSIEPTL